MGDCPELSVLERGHAPDHVATCASCRIVVDLLGERRRAVDSRDRRAECARFEMLLAARDEGTLGPTAAELLEAHLRECRDCTALAATGAPLDDGRPATLPNVPTSAYALGREVARGGMGRILEAQDLRIGRPVAVKELLGRSPALAARFEREARVTARLQHPGIVPIYEIGAWPDGTPFYAMRMVEGRTLRDAIRDARSLDERLALLPAMIDAAEAVAFAHGKRIIHRDLTPNNILVGAHGDTVVIDWGLAKDLSVNDDEVAGTPYRDAPAASPHLTNAGAVIGTIAYMPPEQARGDSVDERADVYALGAILYHVLAGDAPYRGRTSEDLVGQVLAAPPQSVTKLAPGAPRDLASLVEKAMAREPSARYSSAAELTGELRRFQTGRLVEAHHYSRAERARRWLRAHRALVIASAATVAAVAIAGSIGFAGIVRERDHAEHERSAAVVANETAQRENATLMAEQGRQELLAGNTTRALAWLNEAYKAGDTSEELRFMLGTALQRVEAQEHTFPCEVHNVAFSSDGKRAVGICANGIGIVRTSDWRIERQIAARSDGGALSHDGRRIAIKQWETLTVYDADTGAQVFSRHENRGFIRAVEFTADDRRLITTGDDGKARIWDASTGDVLQVLDAQSGKMNVVRGGLTPDGKTLVTGTADGLLREWDVATGRLLREVQLPGQAMLADPIGGFSPDGTRLATCGADGNVRIVNITTGEIVTTLTAHALTALECIYSSDGHYLLTTGFDGTAKVWDVATNRLVSTLRHGGIMIVGTFSPDGERVATVSADGVVKMWHTATGSLLASIDDPYGLDKALVFSPDGHRLITAREPSTLVVSRDLQGAIEPRSLGGGRRLVSSSPTARTLALAAPNGGLSLVDAQTLAAISHEPMSEPVAWSHDATRFAAVSRGDVVVIDTQTGATIARVSTAKPEGLALDEHGRRLLVANAHSAVWDVDLGRVELALGNQSDKDSLARGGDYVVAWDDPKSVELWSISEHRILRRFALEKPTLGPVGFDASGRHLVLAERDDAATIPGAAPWLATLRFYDTSTGAELATAARTTFTSLDYSGAFVVSSGLDKKLTVRSARDGTIVHSFAPGPAFFMAGESLANGAFVRMYALDGMTIRSAVDGRVLAVMMLSMLGPDITQDTFLINSEDTRIAGDGRTLVTYGPHPLVWQLPREDRSPSEVDKIVRERIRWKVVDGHLVPRDATLHGRVLRHGAPVAGATISFEGGALASWVHVTSDRNGLFEIPGLRYGHYGLVVMAPAQDAKGMHDLTIDSDDVRNDLDLDEEATISGTVIDDHGQPVPGVHVRAGKGDGALSAVTDAGGRFTIGALAAQTYPVYWLAVIDGKPVGLAAVGPVSVDVVVRSKTDHVTGVQLVVRRTN